MKYFFEGGPLFMGLLSLTLIGLLWAALKMPNKVQTVGRLALGVLGFVIGIFEMFKALEQLQEVFLKTCWREGLK